MLARSATELPSGERWAFEVKWDGFRALVHAHGRRVRLQSRKGNDLTALFPELQSIASRLEPGTVVDGEIVAFGADGRPDFERLQQRLGASGRRLSEIAAAHPVRLVAFDLPVLAGRSLCARQWSERKERLAALRLDGAPAWVPPHHLGDGTPLQALTRELRLEGVVAKRVDGRYEPGRRTGAWRKIKNWQQIELVVGGWVPGEDGGPASLLLGEPCADGRVRWACVAELGLFGELRRALAAVLPDLAVGESPFADRARVPGARWVQPLVRVRCQYLERTASGRLRHVLLQGLCVNGASPAA